MGKKKKEELQAAIDRGEYGKPLRYDANFLGPRAKRSCTDVICFLLFVFFVIAWAVVGIIAFKQGDPAKFVAPLDSRGRRCGFDAGVENKKYMFYLDITKCTLDTKSCDTPKVCIEECPSKIYVADIYFATGKSDVAISESICSTEPKPSSEEDLKTAINNNRCAAWYIPFRSVANRCIWVSITDVEKQDDYEELSKYLSEKGIELKTIVENSKAAQTISQIKKVGDTIVSDLKEKWPLLLGGLVIAMALCMIYILIMRWFAWIIVWFSLFGIIGLLAFCCYATWMKYEEARDAEKDNDSIDISIDTVLTLKTTWFIFFIISCIVLGIVLLIIIFLRKRIRIAVALITEASRAVGSIMSTLFFPLGPWLLQIGFIAWTIFVWLYLASSGLPVYQVNGIKGCTPCTNQNGFYYSDGDQCDPTEFDDQCKESIEQCEDVSCKFKEYESRSYTSYFHVVNVVGFFWVLCFISAFSDMALAGTFSTWYWTFKKSKVPFLALSQSVGRALRYHMGTLAFGSLILAICRLIRVIIELVDSKLRKYDNTFVKCVMCCCRCFFWCLDRFIKFVNRNAYIMCAIHGKNFCRSAHKSFNLLMRNILRVAVVDKVTDFLLLLGKLLITGAMVAISFYVFSNSLTVDEDEKIPEYTYYILPIIIVGLGTYFVTCIFFSVYAMAVDTLFLCFLEDLERNDGSVEKPYYMSKKLMKILGKKNKKYKVKDK